MFFLRLQTIPDYMLHPRWHKEASRRQNPHLYVEAAGPVGKSDEQIMLSSAIWNHVNIGIRNIGDDVSVLQSFHDHILSFMREHALDAATSSCASKSDYFLSVLDMPKPCEIFVSNPNVAKNKGSGKRVKGPREIAIEKSKKLSRVCGYCNERGAHDKRKCPKKLLDETSTQEDTAEPLSDDVIYYPDIR